MRERRRVFDLDSQVASAQLAWLADFGYMRRVVIGKNTSNAEIRAAVIKAFPDLKTPRGFAFAKFAPQRAFLLHDVMHIDDVADFAALHVFYRGCKYCFINER